MDDKTAHVVPQELDNEGAVAAPERHDANIEAQTRIRRLFGFVQIFAFSLTFMSSWEGMATNFYFAIYNGGPQTFAWSIVVVYIGALAQSASLAEMASIQPLAGAQYLWTYHLAPERWRRLVTWIQGWTTWFGWVSLEAGMVNITAMLLQSAIVLNNPQYTPQPWHTTLTIYAMLVVQGLMNMYVFWLIPWLELIAGIGHVCLFIIFVVVLVTMGPRHSAKDIFLKQEISTGWGDTFVSWNIGMMICVWSFVGFDGALHMSEEVRKAKQAVPRAVFWTIALNGILAYAMVMVLLTVMPPTEELLQSGFPLTYLLEQATGSVPATTAMIVGLFIISFCVCLASIASASRLTWAWSRDHGLPSFFALVSRRHRVPARAIWLVVVVVGLLSLLTIGSKAAVAFNAIVALSSLALYFSYFIAISCMVHARFRNPPVKLGGWNMGRYGLAVNIYALVYTLWIMIFLPFPTALPVTGVNLNYCGPIFGAVLLFALGFWVLRGRKHWPGPNLEIIKLVIDKDA